MRTSYKVRYSAGRGGIVSLLVELHDESLTLSATEPFDEVLDRNIWSMYAERTAWEVEVSGQRKERPRQLREGEIDMEKRRNHAEWLPDGDEEEEGELDVSPTMMASLTVR